MTPPRDQLVWPFGFETLDRRAIESRLGTPAAMEDSSKCVRPAGADTQILLERSKEGDPLDPVLYELPGVGGILVFYSSADVALLPAIVVLRVDESFVPLRAETDLAARREWEVRRLRRLRQWLRITADIVVQENRELKVTNVPELGNQAALRGDWTAGGCDFGGRPGVGGGNCGTTREGFGVPWTGGDHFTLPAKPSNVGDGTSSISTAESARLKSTIGGGNRLPELGHPWKGRSVDRIARLVSPVPHSHTGTRMTDLWQGCRVGARIHNRGCGGGIWHFGSDHGHNSRCFEVLRRTWGLCPDRSALPRRCKGL